MASNFSEIVLLTHSSYYYDIVEWIEYYEKLGFDHITIYNNGELDLSNFIKKFKNISYQIIKGWPNQLYLELNHYNKSNYEWIYFCDDDEFLWLDDKYKNINDFLIKKHAELECDNIAIHWVKISGNPCPIDRKDTPDTTQIKTFHYIQEIENDSWIKCFYHKGQNIEQMQCHYCYPFNITKDVNNNLFTNFSDCRTLNYDYQKDDCLIYHYYHKSYMEFIKKMQSADAVYQNIKYINKFPECDFKTHYNYFRLLYNIGYCKYDNKIENKKDV